MNFDKTYILSLDELASKREPITFYFGYKKCIICSQKTNSHVLCDCKFYLCNNVECKSNLYESHAIICKNYSISNDVKKPNVDMIMKNVMIKILEDLIENVYSRGNELVKYFDEKISTKKKHSEAFLYAIIPFNLSTYLLTKTKHIFLAEKEMLIKFSYKGKERKYMRQNLDKIAENEKEKITVIFTILFGKNEEFFGDFKKVSSNDIKNITEHSFIKYFTFDKIHMSNSNPENLLYLQNNKDVNELINIADGKFVFENFIKN